MLYKSSGYVLLLGIALGMLERHTGVLRKQLSAQFRAPEPGSLFAWIPKKVMRKNDVVAKQMVDFIAPDKDRVILEIGPGYGFVVEHLLEQYGPSKVYGVELSLDFFQGLQLKLADPIESGKVVIRNQDAKDLSFLEDDSVDYIFAMNVVYFLDPLGEYLTELIRVLKPGGKIAFGVWETAKSMDPSIFVNQDWNIILQAMKQAGLPDASEAEPGTLVGDISTAVGTILTGSKPLPPVEEKPEPVGHPVPAVETESSET